MIHPQSRITRGRGRERGGRGRGFRGRAPFSNPGPSLPVPQASQKRLKTIESALLETDDPQTELLQIKGVQYVASYNWTDKDSSTILVPGQPPKWLPPASKQQLREDSGQYYRDLNAANYAQCPTEPAVRAVYELNPDCNASSIDLFGCASTVDSLLSFVIGGERTFRFGVERVGKTIFLVRKTNTPREVLEDVRGYGHSFPEAYTVWEPEVKGSSSHQRIIQYDFAGLRCMIRSKSDGYLSAKASPAKLTTRSPPNVEEELEPDSPEDSEYNGGALLKAAFSRFGQTRERDDTAKKLSIKRAGRPIEQPAVFDLKTRSVKRKDIINLAEFYPRLWVNQTPNFILAWHASGVFDDIEVKDVRNDIIKWEQDNQDKVRKFHNLLKTLKQISETHTRFEVRRTEAGPLEIWSEVKGWTALPTKLKTQWRGEAAELEDDEDQDKGVAAKVPDNDEEDEYLRF